MQTIESDIPTEIYQGQFGTFTITDRDRQSVIIYRSALMVAAIFFNISQNLGTGMRRLTDVEIVISQRDTPRQRFQFYITLRLDEPDNLGNVATLDSLYPVVLDVDGQSVPLDFGRPNQPTEIQKEISLRMYRAVVQLLSGTQ